MCLQDIPINNSSTKNRVMFDNRSELTLMSSYFTKKNDLPYEQATYTLAGIGSNATTYNNGKIYTVPLVDSNGEVILVKAFSVDNILTEKIGREEVVFNKEDFPHLSKAVLEKAAKPLNNKYLDVLIGNPNLGWQPVEDAVPISLSLDLDMFHLGHLERIILLSQSSNMLLSWKSRHLFKDSSSREKH